MPEWSKDEKKQFKLWNEGRLLLCEQGKKRYIGGRKPRLLEALAKIASSSHRDAQWLTSLAQKAMEEKKCLSSEQDLCHSLRKEAEKDTRAKFFLGILQGNMALIEEAAKGGYEFAQCVLMFPFAAFKDKQDQLADGLKQVAEKWRWAAAEKGEPEAIMSFASGIQDHKTLVSVVRCAAELGHLDAMKAMMSSKASDERKASFWALSVYETGIPRLNLSNLDFEFKSVARFVSGQVTGGEYDSKAQIVFLFGRFMHEKNLRPNERKVFWWRTFLFHISNGCLDKRFL